MNWSKSRKVFRTACMVAQALIPAKRKRQIISTMVVALFFGFTAQAQTGDWQAIENLKPGTRISVKARHRVRCVFQRASQDELACERFDRLFRTLPSKIVFDRQSVREVRLERSNEANAAVGAAIGAGAGAAAGASSGNGTLTRGGGALLLGCIGAIVGWFFGANFHILHGKTIYKR
jgi:hypothetical protein